MSCAHFTAQTWIIMSNLCLSLYKKFILKFYRFWDKRLRYIFPKTGVENIGLKLVRRSFNRVHIWERQAIIAFTPLRLIPAWQVETVYRHGNATPVRLVSRLLVDGKSIRLLTTRVSGALFSFTENLDYNSSIGGILSMGGLQISRHDVCAGQTRKYSNKLRFFRCNKIQPQKGDSKTMYLLTDFDGLERQSRSVK